MRDIDNTSYLAPFIGMVREVNDGLFNIEDIYRPAKPNNNLKPSDINVAPKQKKVPNGCKEYFFNHIGDFLNHNDGLYCYRCIAMNDGSAIAKFNKWAAVQK